MVAVKEAVRKEVRSRDYIQVIPSYTFTVARDLSRYRWGEQLFGWLQMFFRVLLR